MEILSLKEIKKKNGEINVADIKKTNDNFKKYVQLVRTKCKSDFSKSSQASEFKPIFNKLIDSIIDKFEKAHEDIYGL